jgi:tetratricopeptide (TPR) repeat protein
VLRLAEDARGSQGLDREAANVRAGLRTLLERRPPDALRLCVALLPFWLRRIELGEGRRQFAAALDAVPDTTALRAEALLGAAAIEFRSGALTNGIALAESSREVAVEIGDREAEWRALQFLGEFGVAADAVDIAVPWLEQALELAHYEGFEAPVAIGIHSLAVAHWIQGDLEGADRLLADSIEGFRSREGTPDTIPSPLSISEIRTARLRGPIAVRHVFEDTLQPLVEISCAAAASYALANQAGIAWMLGDHARSLALLDESAARFTAAGDRAGLAAVCVRRAYLALAGDDLDGARRHFETALELRGELSDRRGRGLVLSGLGLVETAAGRLDEAEGLLVEALDIFRRAGDRWGLASTLWRAADLGLARGDLDEAEAALQEAVVVLGETQRQRWIASTYAGLAEVSLRRGDADRAAGFLGEARARYASRDDVAGVAEIDSLLAGLTTGR